MTGKAWQIALVGCGGVAAYYRHRYTQIPRARLALLVDVDAEVAREAAGQLGVTRWSTEFEEALAPEIDIIDLSTPNHLHAPQAIAAIEAHKHVLLQKPIAPTIEDAQAIVDVARRSGVRVGMCMGMLNDPFFHELRKMIREGLLGRVSAVHCRGGGNGGLTMPPDNWRGSVEKTGGGSFIQLAIHPINMAQWLLDDRIVRVAAFSKNLMCPNIGGDDLTAAACEFASGILGNLASSYCAKPSLLAIYGTKGYAIVLPHERLELRLEEPYVGGRIVYDQPGQSVSFTLDLDPRALYKQDNPFDQHVAFVRAVQEGKPAPVPAEVGLRDLKIVMAVYQSAREQRFVEID